MSGAVLPRHQGTRPQQSRAVGAADKRGRALRAGLAAGLVLLSAAACTRPTGDFGRARGSFTHDVVMTEAGKWRASAAGEPVSSFNWADEEELMHNRVWRFLIAPHAHDWFYDLAVEWQRTRLLPAQDHRFDADRYYKWLHRTDYRSSRVRYRTVENHAELDLATLPDTFTAICAVIEIDRQRAMSLQAVGIGDVAEAEDVYARKAENDMHIGWFARALRYRYDSYSFALDRLLIETPHEEAIDVDARLESLAGWVARAERRDFCGGAGAGSYHAAAEVLPSRVLMSAEEGSVYRK